MDSFSMTLDQNLTLFETNKQILSELKNTNIQLRQVVIYQQQTCEQLHALNQLMQGFTNNGASLNGYIPDAFVSAYVSVLGPVLAKRLDKDDIGLEELMKGATLLARRLQTSTTRGTGQTTHHPSLSRKSCTLQDKLLILGPSLRI